MRILPCEEPYHRPRALIEFLIVTAGVLLALALDQWMENRKDRAEEALLLGAVRTELQSILKDMEGDIAFRQDMMKNANHVNALAIAETRADPAAFDKMLAQMLWWSSVDFTIGAVNSILVGGKLRLIENEEIRFFLASLPDRLASVKQVETNDYWTVMNITAPYLTKHGDFSQILVAMGMKSGGEPGEEIALQYRPKTPRDHTELLNDPQLSSVVGYVAASQVNVVSAYNDLRPQFKRVIGLLDAELSE